MIQNTQRHHLLVASDEDLISELKRLLSELRRRGEQPNVRVLLTTWNGAVDGSAATITAVLDRPALAELHRR